MLAGKWEENELGKIEDCPAEQAKVEYDGLSIKEVGQICTPTQVQNQPKVTWTTNNDKYYTLVLMDPDAPSRTDNKFGEWYHWGVTNIKNNNISNGDVMAEYVGAGPPEGTGLHRYIFLIYEQEGKLDFKGEKLGMSTNGRNNHSIKKKREELGFGKLVAGNCFQAEFDDYVPKLYEKLGAK